MYINDFDTFKKTADNYNSITVKRGADGFGSQMYAAIIGYLASNHVNKKYYYSDLSPITLKNVGVLKNISNDTNNLLKNLMNNLDVKHISSKDKSETCLHIQLPYACVTQESFLNGGLQKLQNAWPMTKPAMFSNNHNVCIHVRRGTDTNQNDKHRWLDSSFYEDMLKTLFIKYPTSKIHIFCWGDSGLSHIQNENLIIHNSDGHNFISDYNALVHADVLVVAGSTFSISAAFFNKNLVLCSNKIVKFNSPESMNCKKAPFPNSWETNYNDTLK